MGFNSTSDTPTVPPEAQSASSKPQTRVKSSQKSVLKLKTTLRRETLLGIARPIWQKVLESECRQIWMEEMKRKDLVVRDIDLYSKSIGGMLRSEELRFQEKEREILKGLMDLKLRDEKLNYRVLRQNREEFR